MEDFTNRESKLCLLVLSGLPASGKSTLALQLQNDANCCSVSSSSSAEKNNQVVLNAQNDYFPVENIEKSLEYSSTSELSNGVNTFVIISYDKLLPEELELSMICGEEFVTKVK